MFSIDLPSGVSMAGRPLAVVADDDPDQRSALARHLTGCGYAVHEASDGPAALALIGELLPELALLRRTLDGCDGERIAALVPIVAPHTRVILTSSRPDLVTGDAFPVLRRPVDPGQLDRCLAAAA
ncbi:response regulator [Azospirillum halopraeferens]|uniref:response regulator n=1 Tax=Azospirillum halopraeferens TaxID=34010 RepID=UPI0004224B43|nr:response regulator [Azospirillum halopraeferens]